MNIESKVNKSIVKLVSSGVGILQETGFIITAQPADKKRCLEENLGIMSFRTSSSKWP